MDKEMYLIFGLGRLDVFPLGDLGLINGIKKLYGLENPTNAEILKITNKWTPIELLELGISGRRKKFPICLIQAHNYQFKVNTKDFNNNNQFSHANFTITL